MFNNSNEISDRLIRDWNPGSYTQWEIMHLQLGYAYLHQKVELHNVNMKCIAEVGDTLSG